ncbi:ketoacyl-ACP synthase III [Legionella impletisoli]|uniref:3-oxoacyl-ACP synthase n=1 Tax=Legionella impletisoli TaxID=343510 RepID=A0A917N985_9GAMM|nr:ketoacyl-ACP synthase III [Legionella impletisoli]GGI80007.1 3-oxoacyl-ACP synthase [Legionella impletisoli]
MIEVGISDISYYLPIAQLDNLKRAEVLSASEQLIRDKIGMLQLARKSDDETTTSLAVKAVEQLCFKNNLNHLEIDCLILVTQNPDGFGLPHNSALVHSQLNLSAHCAAFDVSLGCSGYVYGLSIIKSFMESNHLKKGVLITADPYSKIVDMNDRNTSLLFGDASTATLLESDAPWQIGSFDFGTDGAESMSLYVDESHKLQMNGRNVFNFSAKKVPVSIASALEKNHLSLSDIDQIILHQGSRYIVETIAERIEAQEKTPFVAGNYGNTISSSIPMSLAREQVLKKSKRVIISGFGVGLSWATTVLTNSKKVYHDNRTSHKKINYRND